MADVLVVEDLSVHFGDVHALDGMSFEVAANRLVGFVGPNGSGKTTTMRTIVGLVEPQRGQVRWDGAPIDQVAYFGRLTGMDKTDARDAARAALARFGLADRLDAKVQELSHGNQQRVQLAVALVHRPDLLLLDEPFSGLDPLARNTMAELLRDVADAGATVLLSSHELDLVESLCQDAVIVSRGRCVAAGDVDALRARAPDRTVRVVFAAPTVWHPTIGTVRSATDRRVELTVGRDVHPEAVLADSRRHGEVESFVFEPPGLPDLFRELVS